MGRDSEASTSGCNSGDDNSFLVFCPRIRVCRRGQNRNGETERRILESARKQTPTNLEFSFYGNKAQVFLDLAADILDARVAAAHGENEQAIKYWEKPVRIEDALLYGEPLDGFTQSANLWELHCC